MARDRSDRDEMPANHHIARGILVDDVVERTEIQSRIHGVTRAALFDGLADDAL